MSFVRFDSTNCRDILVLALCMWTFYADTLLAREWKWQRMKSWLCGICLYFTLEHKQSSLVFIGSWDFTTFIFYTEKRSKVKSWLCLSLINYFKINVIKSNTFVLINCNLINCSGPATFLDVRRGVVPAEGLLFTFFKFGERGEQRKSSDLISDVKFPTARGWPLTQLHIHY